MQIPASLAAYRQFVLWILRPPTTSGGKPDKVPVNAQGRAIDPHNPANLLSADEATAALAHLPGAGIGFVFSANDPFFFLDIDGALQPDNTWSATAADLCGRFRGCFVEVSTSGTGLHIIGAGNAPVGHRTRCQQHSLELYTHSRFIALTGTHAQGDPAYLAQPSLDWLVATFFPPDPHGTAPADWTMTPDPQWTGETDDELLIKKMLSAKGSAGGAFAGKASLSDLWNGNAEALAIAYPPASESSRLTYGYDHSSADAALCQHLAFWTGRDCERIDRLFRQSALYRDKWERTGYMQSTVTGAVARCQAVYSHTPNQTTAAITPAHPAPEATPTEPGCQGLRDGMQLMSVPSQVDYFKGCVYIRSLHRAFVPDGELLKPEQFKAHYGGYTFSLDMCNDKVSRNAWEALTENQGYNFPKAHDACFRPELPPGEVIEEEGRTVVNTYVPVVTESRPGDPAPFLNHLEKMLPVPTDRAILLAYMAALVQYPGVKFQWWPLLQGMEGNGKSLIIRVLSFCVGQRYSHTPNAKDIDNKFNAWIRNKLFIGVEEIYTADRQDKIDALKPLITNDRIELQGKGADQVTGDNRANGILNSNHKDAVRKTLADRRYCVFYTAQQEPGDLEKYGMVGDYFPDLYDWLKQGGYAVVNFYLRSYAVPDMLNPATHCHRAPATSSTMEAIRASMGGIEQEIVEAIEEGRPGFAGGWISSIAFDRLLEERRACSKIPRSKRRDILRGLGYDWHTALPDGRVNNPIVELGVAGRPRLYIRDGHPHSGILHASDAVRRYQEAQAAAGSVTVAGAAFGQQ